MSILTRLLFACLGIFTILPAFAFSFDFTLSSPVFNDGKIPTKYTCQGANISPPLNWDGAPPATVSYALVMEDLDVKEGAWTHWVLYNIPLGTTSLQEGIAVDLQGMLAGNNSWNNDIYQGPCPPQGMHHYQFSLYALNQALYVAPNLNLPELQKAMKDHIIGTATLIGTYSKGYTSK